MGNIQEQRSKHILSMYNNVPQKKEVIQKSEQTTELQKSELHNTTEFNSIDNIKLEQYRGIIQKGVEKQQLFGVLNGTVDVNTFVKAIQRAGLVQKKVIIHAKDGSQHQAIRWVKDGSDESPHIEGKHYAGVKDSHVGNNFDEIIKHAMDSDKSPVQKGKDLVSHGIYDKALIMKITGLDSQGAYDILYHAGIKTKDFKDAHDTLAVENGDKVTTSSGSVKVSPAKMDMTTTLSDAREALNNKDLKSFTKEKKAALAAKYGITVNDKWDSYALGVEQVIRLGAPKSLLSFGTGGVGKTYTLTNSDKSGVLDRLGLEKFDPDVHDKESPGQWDWVELGGSMSKTTVWENLYLNKDKLVVFDDCDSQWDDPDMVNILKKILDSSGDGLVTYSGSKVKDSEGEYIKQMKFTGKVIFVSNLTREELVKKGAGPIVSSRSMAIDLTMSRVETMERIEAIADKVKIRDNGSIVPVTDEEKKMALDFMKEFVEEFSEDQLNIRVFNNLASKAHFLKKLGVLTPDKFIKEAVIQLGLA